MSKIGLIGGITPESTILYYRILNDLSSKNFGSGHSAELVINALNFGKISSLQQENRWDLLDNLMVRAAKILEKAGVSCIIIGANTMHLCVDAIKKEVNTPVIHIAEATAREITYKKIKKVGLLGTKFTMEKDFFKDILGDSEIQTLIPENEERIIIHNIIYNELSKGIIKEDSKKLYLDVINNLIKKGAQGIVLGCTEIPILIKPEDVELPVFDTTKIHATAAFNYVSNQTKNQQQQQQ